MSGLRNLDDGFDPAIVATIDARLRSVADAEHARVLLAVESGSRAWGFPSPDSDYDCRFIYVRRSDDYLALLAPRDVIELPADAVLDVNGWDLKKALQLLLKGNAVVIEWLTSPFVYGGDARFRADALALARLAAHPAAVARHYLHLGERQRRTYFADTRAIPLKKMVRCGRRWRCVGCGCIPARQWRRCTFPRWSPRATCRSTCARSSPSFWPARPSRASSAADRCRRRSAA